MAVSEKAVEQDEVAVRGVIANKPTHRETPRGKRITDLAVRVRNELTGSNCYLPCICWQEQADEAAQWQQGDTVELLGRYQSRQYEKVLDAATGEREQRTANMLGITVIDANQIKQHLEYEEKRQERAASDYAKLHSCEFCSGSKLYSCTGYDCRDPYRRAYEHALSRIRERQET